MDRVVKRRTTRIWATCFICIVVILGVVSFGVLSAKERNAYVAHSPENLIRLHVIAHSDEPEDQYVKLQVRDAVVQEMGRWPSSSTIDEMETALAANQHRLQSAAERAVREAGADYEVRVDIGQALFEQRQLGPIVFPAGSYRAVRILIGEAVGQNWWCVLFPPLCFVEDDTDLPLMPVAEAASSKEGSLGLKAVDVRLKLWDVVSNSTYAEALREFLIADHPDESSSLAP